MFLSLLHLTAAVARKWTNIFLFLSSSLCKWHIIIAKNFHLRKSHFLKNLPELIGFLIPAIYVCQLAMQWSNLVKFQSFSYCLNLKFRIEKYIKSTKKAITISIEQRNMHIVALLRAFIAHLFISQRFQFSIHSDNALLINDWTAASRSQIFDEHTQKWHRHNFNIQPIEGVSEYIYILSSG